MKKAVYLAFPFLLAGIIVFWLLFLKGNFTTNQPTSSSSFQMAIPKTNFNAFLKKSVNAAVVEIKRDNAKVNLETPLEEVSLSKSNNEEYVYQSKKEDVEIRYKSIDKGIKEEIILHKLPDLDKLSEPDSPFVEFSLNMSLDNLTVGTNADNMPIFFDQQTGKYQFHFQKPFAKDAKGETTNSLAYEILPNTGPNLPPKIQTLFPYLKPALIKTQKASRYLAYLGTYLGSRLGINSYVLAQSPSAGEGGQRKRYTLILEISKAWLTDSKRVFPILLDPSVVYDPGNSKPEIIEKRTATSRTFAKGDGSLIGIFTTHEQNYKDENGTWQKVNENLGDNEDFDGFAYDAKEMKHEVKIGGNGKRKWYPRRNVKDEYITIGGPEYLKDKDDNNWQSLPLGEVKKTKRQISWENDNYSLKLLQNWHRIKFDLILKNQNAPTSFRWPIGLNNLTWDEWKIKAKNIQVAEVTKPTAFDANGKAVPLNVSYAGGYIEISADVSGKTFPITIDPTFNTPQDSTVADTLIRSTTPDNNYGVIISLVYISLAKSLINFDLSSIPATATCDSATLHTFASSQQGFVETITFYILAVANRDWVEGTKNNAAADVGESTWNYKIHATGSWAGSAGCSTAGTDYINTAIGSYTDVANDPIGTEYSTSLTAATIDDFFAGTLPLIFFITSGTQWHFVGSSDHTTAGYRPYLAVVYTEAAGETPSPTLPPAIKFEKIQMEGIKID